MVKQKYRKERSNVIASFNFVDIAEGTGVVVFLGANNIENTTRDYYLSANSLASNDINTQAADAASKVLDIDFDVVFNLPQRLKGIVHGQIPIGGRSTSAAPNGFSVYAIIKLRHVTSGGAETEIAQARTETTSKTSGAVNVKASKVMNFKIDASSSITKFKKAEALRITVEIYGAGSAGNANIGFGHDPKDRTDDTAANGGIIADDDSTQFKINVPFLLKI